MGYISYLNPETGEIEAKHKEPADRTKLPTSFDEAMMKVAEMVILMVLITFISIMLKPQIGFLLKWVKVLEEQQSN
jgi:hypothetical protein